MKKLFKQTIAVFMVCVLLIGTIGMNTAFASTNDSNDKIITTSSEKADNNIVKNISSEKNSTELNRILGECKEVNTDNSSGELRRGEMISVSEQVSSVSADSTTMTTMAIMKNGDLYCWGRNGSGLVGNGTTIAQTTPIKVLSNISSVSIYSGSVGAITKNGDLYCWGSNDHGQVGNGTTIAQTTPIKVLSNISSFSTSAFTFGSGSVGAITKNGDLYCWGRNYYGQVGNGTTIDQTTPVKVLSNVSFFSCSDGSYGCVAAITKNGDLYCWGNNYVGQVGNGTTNNQTTPVKVLSNVSTISVFSSNYEFPTFAFDIMAAITKNGDLYCWGKNVNTVTTPVKILSDVSSVYGYGLSSVAAITKNGDLYCLGNFHGIPTDQIIDPNTPVKVLSNVSSVSSYNDSYGCVAAITKNGDLYCWGRNYDGQVGNGSTNNQTTPIKVLSDVSSVSIWSDSVAAVTKNGDLYCWGSNDHGQVGNGSTINQTTPVKVLSTPF